MISENKSQSEIPIRKKIINKWWKIVAKCENEEKVNLISVEIKSNSYGCDIIHESV